jgi:hypothetical protein
VACPPETSSRSMCVGLGVGSVNIAVQDAMFVSAEEMLYNLLVCNVLTIVTNQNSVQEEIKTRLNLVNVCHISV